MREPTVSVEWLWNNKAKQNLIVLYTRLADIPTGKLESSDAKVILNARLFDFEDDFVDATSNLPHTMPSQKDFEIAAQRLGINKDSVIVVYDSQGLFASPRAWWMFKSMGHDQVYVLDGGLPAWARSGYPISSTLATAQTAGDFTSKQISTAFVGSDAIVKVLNTTPTNVIVDARSSARFEGTQPEPRVGIRSGHVPSSINIPFQVMLNDGHLKSSEQIDRIFQNQGVNASCHLYFSCGSGVTACILALAAYSAGYRNLHVYDGSWTEWGGNSSFPIAK